MRAPYNLGNQTHRCGMIGRLQMLNMVPVIAGDSLEMNLDAIIRLAPLRKEIVQEGVIDIHAFYVPHRHVYGEDIVNMILQGADETVTLTGVNIGADYRTPVFLGMNECGASLPTWFVQGVNRIWDRYYRVPTMPRIEDSANGFNSFPTDSNELFYGKLCARLPSPLNGGTDVSGQLWPSQDLEDEDYEAALGTGVVDVRDIAQAQARVRSEIKRTWMANDRYTDVLDEVWGTNVNIDADQRPEMLWGDRTTFSGQDVNGTDDATLGSYIGKTVARVNWRMPRRHFPEHGAVWVFALVRFPLIHQNETHPLAKLVNPDGKYLLADPTTWQQTPPVPFAPGDWLSQQNAVAPDTMEMPYGQHYRVQPNYVHANFGIIDGYPFEDESMTTASQFMYHSDNDYNDVFQTTQLGHWQLHGAFNTNVFRRIPDAIDSIYAGTN